MSCCKKPKCKQIGKTNKTVRYAEDPNRNLVAEFDESTTEDTRNLTEIINTNSEKFSNNNTYGPRTFNSLVNPIKSNPRSSSNGNRNRTNFDMTNTNSEKSSTNSSYIPCPSYRPPTFYSLVSPMNINPPSGSNSNRNRTNPARANTKFEQSSNNTSYTPSPSNRPTTFYSLVSPMNSNPPRSSNGNRNGINTDIANTISEQATNNSSLTKVPRTFHSIQSPMNSYLPSRSNGNGNRTFRICNNSNQNVNQTYTVEDNANESRNTPQNITYNIESYDNNRTFVICPSKQNTKPKVVNETYVIDTRNNETANNPNATYIIEAPPSVNDETYVVAPDIDNETYIICPSTNSTGKFDDNVKSELQNDSVDSETLPYPADLRPRGQPTSPSNADPRHQEDKYHSSAGKPRRAGSPGGPRNSRGPGGSGGGPGSPGGGPTDPVRPRSSEGPRIPQEETVPNSNGGNATYTVNDVGAVNLECVPCNKNFWRTLQRFIDMFQEIMNYAKDKINQQIEDCGKQIGRCDKCRACIESQRSEGANVPGTGSPETVSEPRNSTSTQRRRCPLSDLTFSSPGEPINGSRFREQAQTTPVVP